MAYVVHQVDKKEYHSKHLEQQKRSLGDKIYIFYLPEMHLNVIVWLMYRFYCNLVVEITHQNQVFQFLIFSLLHQ